MANELATVDPCGASVAPLTSRSNIVVTAYQPRGKDIWKQQHVVHITGCNREEREAYLL